MTKTPEQMAKEYADYFMPGEDSKHYTSLLKEVAFLAGYEAGVKEAEERILNEFFDNYGADEHASFALRVNAYQWNRNDK